VLNFIIAIKGSMTKRIEDYALIGDCESAALVARDGSIDWLCWPRFDSGALFAALLGGPENGHWSLSAAKEATIRRRYRGDTLILETDFSTESGAVTLIDFMPLHREGPGRLIRIVQGRSGEVEMVTELMLRFDYGLIVPWITRMDGEGLQAIAGPDMVTLHSDASLQARGYKHCSVFTVRAGESVSFVLTYGRPYEPPPPPIDALQALEETENSWRRWSQRCTYAGPYSGAVLRSLITLKALTYHPTGGIAAAATTSLPEELGGSRNWDYRYCWLRDATFTLLAFMNSGYRHEAEQWRTWLRRAVAGSAQQVQIVYGLAGERRLIESNVSWLSGYENSKPVRIGNAAANQLQLDIFGEVMDALFQWEEGDPGPARESWSLQLNLLEHLEKIWRMPDEGLWEVRGGARQFAHSKVMAWVAFDRALRSMERFGLEGPSERWRKVRDEIHKQVCEEAFDKTVGAFTQSYGSSALDASALLIPLVGFLPASDPRVQSTVKAIGERLRDGPLVRRYDTNKTQDGVNGSEGAFLACSFWYADNLIMLGRRDEAAELFEFLLTLCNDVGLLSEEYDPEAKRMLGNFPQAFSHVALINTAHNLSYWAKPAEQRGRRRHHADDPISHI
jgi:GH15 family glucan-1,4-alpha-glucosidase